MKTLTGKQQGQAIKDYRKGASIRTVAETHGVAYGTIHKLLVENGVERRPRGGKPVTKPVANARRTTR